MKQSLYIGKILGVRIYVHWTFALLIAWIVFSGLNENLGAEEILWTLGLMTAVFTCIVLHELGHAIVARRFKVVTSYITLLPIGGVAQMEAIPENPRHELLIAIAGPAVNLVISLILIPIVNIHQLLQTESITTLGPGNFLFTLVVLNIWLAIFNLIPAFPMDGGRVLRAILAFRLGYVKATKIATGVGQLFGATFFFAGFIYNPVLIFVGMFVFLSGQFESSMVQTMHFLHAYVVRDVIMREIPIIENSATLRSAGQTLLSTQSKSFVVMDQGIPVGTITRDEIVQAVRETDEETTVDAIKNKNLSYASEAMALDEVWKIMQRTKTPLILVKNNGKLEGIVEKENIAEFILLRSGGAVVNNRKSVISVQ